MKIILVHMVAVCIGMSSITSVKNRDVEIIKYPNISI